MPAINSAQNNTMPMPIPANPHHPMLWSYQYIMVIASNRTARKLFTSFQFGSLPTVLRGRSAQASGTFDPSTLR